MSQGCEALDLTKGSETIDLTKGSEAIHLTKGSESCESPQSQHISSKEICRAKWVALNEITYRDPTGKVRTWEAARRTTKTGSGADAVVIVPVLKRAGQKDSVILVKQYRPPLKTYTMEFPAGLIDKGENPVLCALRELKEETGYVGTHKYTSPGVCLDSGLSDGTINLVTVEVDGNSKENQNADQQQDESEFIEVITAAQDTLLDTLNKYAEEGAVIQSILYTYALGRSM